MAASTMAEAFTLVCGQEHRETVFEDFEDQLSAKTASPAIMFLASVRAHHPGMTVAVTSASNVNLLAFAAAGLAAAKLDISEDNILRSRIFLRPTSHDDDGTVADSTTFARYNYSWKGLKFIMYTVYIYPQLYQYICFPPDSDETVQSNSKATDALLLAAGRAIYGPYQDYIAVFDSYWRADMELYKEVQKIRWDDVILDRGMKDTISHTIEEFFDNESRYRDLDVPWKRGIIFHGPPGNGKTISLRALMHSLIAHEKERPKPITLLYVKSIPYTQSIRAIFTFARSVAPCLLIIEDIDTQVTPDKLSYFFNEVDGLENNDGILMIATTNHLDNLDEGLKRPSRFDRRYLFPLPELGERTQYCEFWRKKLMKNGAKVEFPKELSRKIAGITSGFSFATMKEAFVATLLALARREDDKRVHGDDKGHEDIEDLPLWKEMQVQVKLLRKEMEKAQRASQASATYMDNSSVDVKPCPVLLPNSHHSRPQQGSLRDTHTSVDPKLVKDSRGPPFDALDELHRIPGPRVLRPPGLLDFSSPVCWLRHGGPSTIRPPPPATPSNNATIPASHPGVPLLAGPDPPMFPGDYHVPEREFRELMGQGDVHDKGSGRSRAY